MHLKQLLRFTLGFSCLCAMAVTAVAQPLTFTSSNYTVLPSCYWVVAEDLNGDGKPDLISNSQHVNSLVILTNNGNGQFGWKAALTNNPRFMSPCVAADFNGDGKTDLACAVLAPSLVILSNDGTGSFTFLSSASAGFSGDSGLASADINGDGRIDLLYANGSDNKVYVLTNNGSGFFGLQASPTVGDIPTSVAVGDLNGDGRPDLVTANSGSPDTTLGSTLTVLTNNAAGTFGFKATLNVGVFPRWVTAADINSDGRLDLISANEITGSLTVFTNNGQAIFGLKTNILYPYAYSVVAADFNGDGKVDLASSSDGNRIVTVFTNNGTGVFGSNAVMITSSNVEELPQSLVAVDVDKDGQMDLVAGNQNFNSLVNASVAVFKQTAVGAPTLSVTPTNSTSLAISWSSPSTSFVLQTNGSLTGTNWAVANYPSSTNGQSKRITVNPQTGSGLFFRLKR